MNQIGNNCFAKNWTSKYQIVKGWDKKGFDMKGLDKKGQRVMVRTVRNDGKDKGEERLS